MESIRRAYEWWLVCVLSFLKNSVLVFYCVLLEIWTPFWVAHYIHYWREFNIKLFQGKTFWKHTLHSETVCERLEANGLFKLSLNYSLNWAISLQRAGSPAFLVDVSAQGWTVLAWTSILKTGFAHPGSPPPSLSPDQPLNISCPSFL